ncbi:hypothetical protein BGZ47_001516, partial [Haplosporangium gracile]
PGRYLSVCTLFLNKAVRDTQSEPEAETKTVNTFATIDKQHPANTHQYRHRFSPKVRFELQPASAILMHLEGATGEAKTARTFKEEACCGHQVRDQRGSRFGRKEMLDALWLEHPTVTLDLDRLSSNVHVAVENDPLAKAIVECIRGAVRVACDSKRQCQMLIGLYLEDLFYPPSTPGAPRSVVSVAEISQQDQDILDNLRPRLSSNEMSYNSNHVSSAGDRQDAVNIFISRLQEMGHLEKSQVAKADMLKSVKEYALSFVIRSIASQLSAKLKRHYKHEINMVSEKVQTPAGFGVFRPCHPRRMEYMTFTVIELAALLYKRDELYPILKKLIGCKDERRLAQAELPVQTPGVLIQRLIAPVDPRTPDGDRLRGRQKKEVGIATAVRVVEPEELCVHINTLRGDGFDPRTYQEKGYFLCGSIKTDGHQLQLLACKVRELNSVKFKRYRNVVPPDHLLTTIAGASDFLTEVRNVFKPGSNENHTTRSGLWFKPTPGVERLLGCISDETDKVSYLCIDLGQAFVAGVYGLLPQDKTPKIGKR